MATSDQLIQVLRSWIGIREAPAGSNRTRIGEEFGWNGVAWCAETVSLAHRYVGMHDIWTAAVANAIAAAQRGDHGLSWLAANATVAPGDHVTFDFGPVYGKPKGNAKYFHIATVVDPGTQARFRTIGGNEADAVTDQWRDRRYVQGFIRPAYDQPPTPPPGPTPAFPDRLEANQQLSRGNALVSPNQTYSLDLQGADGHLVLYNKRSAKALWAVPSYGGARLVLQSDGNLVTYDPAGHALWSTATSGKAGVRLNVQDDGNTVLYRADGGAIWATNTAGH